MKRILFIILMCLPVPALADSIVDYCFTTANPKACMQSVMDDRANYQRLLANEQAMRTQLEAARIQAQGLMLFGSGPAFINGMNQHLSNMRVQFEPMTIAPVYPYLGP